MIQCPLCHCSKNSLYYEDKRGEYRLCTECSLVFVLPQSYLNAEDEKKRYDLHTNSSDDLGYRQYLAKVMDPVLERIPENAFGLDFGSGPGPTLSKMFEENGCRMNVYDHFYAKDEAVLTESYDFVTSTEVIEHLYDPKSILDSLVNMLKPRGLLALLTQVYPSKDDFASWYYKNDPTHVCFFSIETMRYLEKRWDISLEILGKEIFIFTQGKN